MNHQIQNQTLIPAIGRMFDFNDFPELLPSEMILVDDCSTPVTGRSESE
jgi:hypothetical protein